MENISLSIAGTSNGVHTILLDKQLKIHKDHKIKRIKTSTTIMCYGGD